MKLWRISRFVDLEGKGGFYSAGRWHHKGRPVIYASEHAALATIEFLVNVVDRSLIPEGTTLYSVEVPPDTRVAALSDGTLPEGWKAEFAVMRAIGTAWLDAVSQLILRVPAATTEGNNFLINPRHADISRLTIVDRILPPFDRRLSR